VKTRVTEVQKNEANIKEKTKTAILTISCFLYEISQLMSIFGMYTLQFFLWVEMTRMKCKVQLMELARRLSICYIHAFYKFTENQKYI